MKLKILKFPDPRLRQKAKPLKFIDKEFFRTVDEMAQLMYDAGGIGLAATQVGIPFRFFVWDTSEEKNSPRVVINPQIIRKEGETIFEEGCLSIPGLRYPTRRAKKIVVKGIDEKGNEVTFELDELESILFQHEIDHLEGKLFIDMLPPSERAKIIKLIRKGELEIDD